MNKLNLQLVQVSQYLFTFELNVHHKSKNQNIVLNVLSQLLWNWFEYQLERENILNALHADSTIKYLNCTIYVFAAFLIKMSSKFKTRLTSAIKADKKWEDFLIIAFKKTDEKSDDIIKRLKDESFVLSNDLLHHKELNFKL